MQQRRAESGALVRNERAMMKAITLDGPSVRASRNAGSIDRRTVAAQVILSLSFFGWASLKKSNQSVKRARSSSVVDRHLMPGSTSHSKLSSSNGLAHLSNGL
jgi:hypothetical protein